MTEERSMKLEGIHHITAITGDAPANVEFYVGVLGLRMVKKTVNQDDPTVYHLFYADEKGSPGADLTFFEYPGAQPGRAGDGMVHRIAWRVAAPAAIDFWERRLAAAGVATERTDAGTLRFADPEGLGHELVVASTGDAPLIADAPDVPREHALQGFDGVRAYASDPGRSAALLRDTLGFSGGDDGAWEVRGDQRGSVYAYDTPPAGRPQPGAGTVHHVAFSTTLEEHDAWQERVSRAGARATPVIDRFYFRSIYFREPSGVLFELATMGPGFSADEDAGHLGERLSLPPNYERYRAELEQRLTPLPNPRAERAATA
jgi:glyoxalase family protein